MTTEEKQKMLNHISKAIIHAVFIEKDIEVLIQESDESNVVQQKACYHSARSVSDLIDRLSLLIEYVESI